MHKQNMPNDFIYEYKNTQCRATELEVRALVTFGEGEVTGGGVVGEQERVLGC